MAPEAPPVWEARVARAALVLFLLFIGLWLTMRNMAPSLLDRDWQAFDRAADRAARAEWAEVYRASAREKFGFLYPPYAIWFTLPLALVPSELSYFVILAASVVMIGVAGLLFGRLPGATSSAARTIVLVTLASGTWMQVAITGQNSAAYVLVLAAALVAEQEDHPRWAGVSLALLLIKPNLVVASVVFAACRRQRHVVEGFLAGGLVLAGSTLLMGSGVWGPFREALRYVDGLERVPQSAHGQVTLLAALRVGLRPFGGFDLAKPVWAVCALAIAVVVGRVWLGGAAMRGPLALRAAGTAVLVTVALNVRLYFYDALILAVPAALWYLYRSSYGSPRRWATIGICIAVAFVAGFSEFGALPTSPLIGVASVVWLLAEAKDLSAASVAARAESVTVAAGGSAA